jgi:hypothetical protein
MKSFIRPWHKARDTFQYSPALCEILSYKRGLLKKVLQNNIIYKTYPAIA